MTIKIKPWATMQAEYGIDEDGVIPMAGDGYTKEMEDIMPENRIIFCWQDTENNRIKTYIDAVLNTKKRRYTVYLQMVEEIITI